MRFMGKAAVIAASISLLFSTSILTRNRADTSWNPQRVQFAPSTNQARPSTSKELNGERENECAEKPAYPNCSGGAVQVKRADVLDGPSAERLSTSWHVRQANGSRIAPSEVQVTGSVSPPSRRKKSSVADDLALLPAGAKVAPIRAVNAATLRSTPAQPEPASAAAAEQEPEPKPAPAPAPVQFRLADRG
jgi:hypothetical protein